MLNRAISRGRLAVVAVLVQLLILLISGNVAQAQLTITATTPSSVTPGSPNTFVGAVGSQIAASLLASGTPALLWGAVPSADIITACQQIVNTGSLSFSASVTNDWGGSEDLTLQVQATGGCLAASDASGTEFVFLDNYGRKSAVVCPPNAGSSGCGVYVTGDDVTALYNSAQGGSKRKLLSALRASATSRRLLDDCNSGAKAGAISGAVTGVMSAGDCLALGPLAPFCVLGVIGVSAGLGAVGGCASSCFPGDALVGMPGGGVRLMSQLQLGDEVAVWGHDGKVRYDHIYAFGHKDADVTAMFVEITAIPLVSSTTNNGTTNADPPHVATIRLSGLHFIPTSLPSSSLESPHPTLVYKRAKDMRIGDIVWSSNSEALDVVLPYVITGTSTSWSQGLYNPLTISGTIIVDDVVASAHSDWFLDAAFDATGLSRWLPHAYQFVLAPVRAIYHVLGQDIYVSLYNQLDACIDIAKFGTSYGGALMVGASTIGLLLLRQSALKLL